jgi:hypothetical protein
MTTTPVRTERVLRATANTREISAALRAMSTAARAHSAVLRRHNREARDRADRLLAALRSAAPVTGDAAAVLQLPGVSTQELADILVEHHGWSAGDAWIVMSVELELGSYPLNARELAAADALDLLDRVLTRGPG